MKSLLRIGLVIFFAYALVMALMTLQYFFDRGDIRRASEVVYEYVPNQKTGKKLLQLMADQLKIDEKAIHCEAEITSRYEGIVQVECGNIQNYRSNSPQLNFIWKVNLVGSQLLPSNDLSKVIVELSKQSGGIHEQENQIIKEQ